MPSIAYLTPEEALRLMREMDNEQEENLKERWKTFYSTTSLHCFHYIFDQRGIARIGWLILVAASAVLSFFFFQGIVTDYSKLTTAVIARDVYQHSMEFPTFSICPFNTITYNKFTNASDHDTSWELYSEYNTIYQNTPKLVNQFETLTMKLNMTLLQVLQQFEISFDEMVNDRVIQATSFKSCKFGQERCNASSFQSVFSMPHEKYEMCHQFNVFSPDKDVKMIKVGEGFEVTLNIHADKAALEKKPYHGLALFVHPYGSPLRTEHASFVPVSPGTFNSIFVKVKQKRLLPPPFDTECGELPYEFISKKYPYTRPMCEMDCYAKLIYKESQCLGFEYLNFVDETLLCTNITKFLDYRIAVRYLDYDGHITTCHKACPRECVSLKYTLKTSETKIGTRKTLEDVMKIENWTMAEKQTKEYINSNIIALKVGFSDPTTTKQENVPTQTWVSMIGGVGGTLGLCLGCSILTLCEFIYFLLNLTITKFETKKSKKEMRERTRSEIEADTKKSSIPRELNGIPEHGRSNPSENWSRDNNKDSTRDNNKDGTRDNNKDDTDSAENAYYVPMN